MTTRGLILLGFLVAACGDDDKGNTDDTGSDTDTDDTGGDTDDTGSDTDDTGGGSGAFAPAEGSWSAGILEPASDGCGIFEDIGKEKGGEVSLVLTSETSFELVSDDFTTSCTLSDQDFTCVPEVSVEDYTSSGLDVVFTSSFGYSGAFSSETSGQVTFQIDLLCEGEDCSVLAKKAELTLPCSSTASADITFVQ